MGGIWEAMRSLGTNTCITHRIKGKALRVDLFRKNFVDVGKKWYKVLIELESKEFRMLV